MRISSLLADPSIRLPGLAAELTQLAGGDVSDGDTESTILVSLLASTKSMSCSAFPHTQRRALKAHIPFGRIAQGYSAHKSRLSQGVPLSLQDTLPWSTLPSSDLGSWYVCLQAGLNGLIRRSGPGYKALANGIVAALQLSVLSANASSSPTRSAIGAALSRCGASSLRAEVEELSDGLCKVAAISEAVHFDVYQRLSIDLL